ncbi:GNAT family N-acetyltransferase [Candidatus Finniella inopinata]|uniref:N-acetyltransferase n=1 Tax=Candidatus Finniella inopinata TaxID=1696036 RepID=A0A4Q7DPI7_9PROT|nr:GNAT family N-acetyltransferase [Candidatus Finniella inopinata]RZI46916.1 N-acetyltransferase [Candidatus Finniella inopinata]
MIESPILLDLPVPFYTSRLMIRPMMPGDGPAVWAAVEESRPQIRKWLPWVDDVKCWQDSEKSARQFYANFILRRDFNFCIFKGDVYVGGCGLRNVNWDVPSATVAYWCRESLQGQGYVTEAVGALTLYAFKEMGFKRLVIRCELENTKSAAVANRLGFDLEMTAKGIMAHPRTEELLTICSFVRFDSSGLENSYSYKLGS